jgi:hypothetical protein
MSHRCIQKLPHDWMRLHSIASCRTDSIVVRLRSLVNLCSASEQAATKCVNDIVNGMHPINLQRMNPCDFLKVLSVSARHWALYLLLRMDPNTRLTSKAFYAL